MGNFNKYDKPIGFVKKFVRNSISEDRSKQVNPQKASRGLGSPSQSTSSTSKIVTTATSLASKLVVYVFGGPINVQGLQELVQRSGIHPKGPLIAVDDASVDRVDLLYDDFSNPNFWMF